MSSCGAETSRPCPFDEADPFEPCLSAVLCLLRYPLAALHCYVGALNAIASLFELFVPYLIGSRLRHVNLNQVMALDNLLKHATTGAARS